MKVKCWLLAIAWQVGMACIAQTQQNDTIQAENELQQVFVSGSKFSERNSKLAVTIKLLRNKDLDRLNISNMGNVLESTGFTFVQRSQQGGGSPVLRGFEASRVLLMVDGVRMNNAIYRSGHLQNIITVDPNILQTLEILYGPSSTLYGSDALGGVVNMFTKNPVPAPEGQKSSWTVNGSSRYASAINEKMLHANVGYSGRNWGAFTSVTFSDFGDVISGEERDSKYADFGLVKMYAARLHGKDTALVNPDPNKMKPSAYEQWDVMQKFIFKPKENTTHVVNLQVSHSTDIPRFDRLSELAGGTLRYAEWYYGPQKRYMASYTLEKKNMKAFFKEVRSIASYQFVEESRYDRRFKQSLRNERMEKINVGAITFDGRNMRGKHELVIGADAQFNFLKSAASGLNIDNGTVSKITTRYPDGKNKMNYAAVYAQHLFKITDHLSLNDGLRLNYVNLSSTFNDTSLFHFPFTSANQDHLAVSGNAGLSYSPGDQFKLAAVFSTGFRSPNIDDLAKLFDSRAGAVIVPNPKLKPEQTYNIELNMARYFSVGNDPFGGSVGGAVFYTWFRNAIVTDKFQFLGQDSIMYAGIKSAVLASQNKAKAYLWGYNVYGHIKLIPELSLNAVYTYTYGRYENNSVEVPLDHVPPAFGRLGLQYQEKKISIECYTLFNSWKHIADYNPNGEDNQQYATADGMPSWYTINARLNYELCKKVVFQFGIENILDRHCRAFASGISAPGRNFILALKTGF